MHISTSIRDYFASMHQRKQDTEFMPEVDGAILEDSPWFTRITVWMVSACLIVALIWANFAVLEEVTTGEGKAIPSSKIQVIQNLEGGIVSVFLRNAHKSRENGNRTGSGCRYSASGAAVCSKRPGSCRCRL